MNELAVQVAQRFRHLMKTSGFESVASVLAPAGRAHLVERMD
jgi:hypothetical protein